VWLERDIRGIAAGQHGVITRTQLVAYGVTDHEIARRIREGRMEQRYDGVYYLDAVPATWLTEICSARFACGPDAIASHRCAAVLWGLDGIRSRLIEVTVPYLASPEPDGVIVHRTRRANPSSVVESIPVSTVEKLMLDLASMLPESVLRKLARSAVHNGLTSPDLLDETIGKLGGRGVTGTRKARRVVGFVADDLSGSAAEIHLKDIVLDAPIPRPVQQLRVRFADGSHAYPDFSWPDRMRIVEVDGFAAHGTPEQFQNDLRRQNQLMDLGWEVRRFTATDIRDRPLEVGAEITRFVNNSASVRPGHA